MSRRRPIIAIDGPVGAGKSVAARALARALGFSYLNTGAMYRAVAIAAREAGVSPEDADVEARLAPVLAAIKIKFDGESIFLNRRDVTAIVSEPEVGELASRFSAIASVRARMRELQRAAGADGGVVMEGRDIGTAIFPDAEFKFFLVADVKTRARRRFEELKKKGASIAEHEVFEQLIERDRRDSGRELAPLKRADDATEIDSTKLSIDAVVAAMKAKINARINAAKDLKRA
ncbi:MAG TPA: (d)CMP kinase [Candidatus Binatus sp.]|uniref:(d)CMP kinase n=1 Tax=Candidatus Binatus sp. TaxID=2811406 RepID=UPI002B4A495C|nr:(d)CMP kinase [Candidatus Binatus sp.]HKN12711.1 (d)CMP kinase [Candidatus Binatus sp.]